MDTNLPPLPPSDTTSMTRNTYDANYKYTAREFWSKQAVTHIPDTTPTPCDHQFTQIPSGVECMKCHVGFLGHFDVQRGKLFIEGRPVGL